MGREAWRRLHMICAVRLRIVIVTAATSALALLVSILEGWPLWEIGVLAALPWLPLFMSRTLWTCRHFGWLALFWALVVMQSAHVGEHVAQMVEIHLLGETPKQAHGIIGQLDIEWVHFGWNTFVLIAVVALLIPFRRNPWLWATLVLAGWHQLEHSVIISSFIHTGQAGDPGLLASGGRVDGGLPLTRADLHFLYNLAETIPLIGAFLYSLNRTYDAWLAKALPAVAETMLVMTSGRLVTLRRKPGETVLVQGAVSDRFYVVARGTLAAVRTDADGGEVEVETLRPGQYFGELGLLQGAPAPASVRAQSNVELLAVDRDCFKAILDSSAETSAEVERTAAARLVSAAAVV